MQCGACNCPGVVCCWPSPATSPTAGESTVVGLEAYPAAAVCPGWLSCLQVHSIVAEALQEVDGEGRRQMQQQQQDQIQHEDGQQSLAGKWPVRTRMMHCVVSGMVLAPPGARSLLASHLLPTGAALASP